MRRILGLAAGAALLAALAGAAPAGAATLTPDSGWASFTFGTKGSSWNKVFKFTLASQGILKITDSHDSGQVFLVKDGKTKLGSTSDPVPGSFTSDFDIAFANSEWSSATFLLGPGSYKIKGKVTKDAGLAGDKGGIRVDTITIGGSSPVAVPLPASGVLLLFGLAALAGLALRRPAV